MENHLFFTQFFFRQRQPKTSYFQQKRQEEPKVNHLHPQCQ